MLKYFFISFFTVLFDQLSKIYIKNFFVYHESKNILGTFLKFTYIENPGIVFGLDVNLLFYYLITFLSICIIVFLCFKISEESRLNINNSLLLISYSLILGGAIGNVIDRLFNIFNLFNYQGVIDFIDMGIGYYRFYIFNIADMSVTIGIVLFILYSYFIDIKHHDFV